MSTVIRGSLVRGPGIVKLGAATYFYTQGDIVAKLTPLLNAVKSSPFATVNFMKTDMVIKVPLKIWGTYNFLSKLFPPSMMSGAGTGASPYSILPVMGKSLIGTAADVPLAIYGENGDSIIFSNAVVTKVPDLYLGVDQEFFEADVEFSCLIASDVLPNYVSSTTNAYYNLPANDGGTAWTAAIAAFATPAANYERLMFTASWSPNVTTGFAGIYSEKGFRIAWGMEVTPAKVDGYGTVDYVVEDFTIGCRFIVPGSVANGTTTPQDIEAQSMNQGLLLGAIVPTTLAGNLVLTAGGPGYPIFTVFNMFMKDYGFLWSTEALRNGEVMLQSMASFTAGARTAIATIQTGA